MDQITLLGSTGSIGTQALDVCRALGKTVVGLSANHQVDLLAAQAREFHPAAVCIADEGCYPALKAALGGTGIRLLAGMDGLCELASMEECHSVLNAVVGMVGLQPTLAAIEAKKEIALANKETLVAGGAIVMRRAKEQGVEIVPVDSEHSAIYQSLKGSCREDFRKIMLTASGGPFYGKTRAELANVTVEQALRHPNWSMGAKITIDSATMMNKGLEVMEACWLFDVTPEEIEIVVHRESVIHSLVEYADGAVIAELGVPDMKVPIAYALTSPKRYPCGVSPLSLPQYGTLTFGKADEETFTCLRACKEAMRRGGLYPAIVNGANEQAVALFLAGKISFLQIGELVEASLALQYDIDDFSVEDILAADALAREFVRARAE